MSEKSNRKEIVANLINSMKLHTQEEIQDALQKKGICVTQATLSRDIKELGAHKAIDSNGETYYKINNSQKDSSDNFILNIQISGQLGLAHTKPGFASALAALIDSAKFEGVMGTIAGDDTVLIIFKVDADAEALIERIKEVE